MAELDRPRVRSHMSREQFRFIIVSYFGAVLTPIRTVAEVNEWERGLETIETEVKLRRNPSGN